MEVVFLNGRRFNKVSVPDKYRFLLQHEFETRNRIIGNIASLLNDHMGDDDCSYLNDDIHKQLSDKAVDLFASTEEHITGIVYSIVFDCEGAKKIPRAYEFRSESDKYDILLYRCR